MDYDVFISYSHYDKPIADAVCATLEKRDIRCWMASRDIPPGAKWASAIEEAISKCRVFVLIHSKTSNMSPQVIREVDRAVHHGLTIIPFRIESVELSESLKFYISSCHWLDAMAPPLKEHIKKLADRVEQLLGNAPATADGIKAEMEPGDKPDKAVINRTQKKSKVKIILPVVIVCILIIAAAVILINNPVDVVSEKGNTGGNIVNNGLVAQKNGEIYYVNASDGNKLYKMEENSEGSIKLNDDTCLYINVVNDWIYYVNGSDENKIYKMKTDGSSRAKLVEEYCSDLNVAGDWIYYSASYMGGSRIYKIKTDGTERIGLNNNDKSTGSYNCVNSVIVDEGWIYFSGYQYTVGDDGTVYLTPGGISRMKTDGTNETLIEAGSICNVSNGYIYYSKYNEGTNLYRMKIDGTGSIKLSGDDCAYVNVEGGWIYYCNRSDGDKLYKIKTDGSGRTKLNDDHSYNINIIEDGIYYLDRADINKSDGEAIYKIKPDGTSKTKVG